MPRARVISLLPLSLPLLPGLLVAQATSARIGMAAGTLTDGRGIRATALSVTPAVAFSPAPAVALVASGSGTRFTTGDWALGGAAGLVVREPVARRLSLLFDGGAGVTRTSYGILYRSAEAAPRVELSLGPVTLGAGGHAAYGASIRIPRSSGGLPTAPSPAASVRTALGGSAGASVRICVPGTHSASVTLAVREQRDRIGAVTITDRSGSVLFATGPLRMSGWLGQRRAADERTTFGGTGIEFAVTPSVSVAGAAEQYPTNRLLGLAGGRSLSAGLVLRTAPPTSH